MQPQRTFIAERPLAQHCAELLPAAAPAADELLPALVQLGERLARSFAAGMGKLSGGDAPVVRSQDPRPCTMAELATDIAPLAASSLLCDETRQTPFLASIEATAVFSLVDRAYGGRGTVPSPLPDAFPLSAELLMIRLESVVAAATGQALGSQLSGPIRTLRRDGSLKLLAPFAADTPLVALTLDVMDTAPWTVTLAFPLVTLSQMFGGERAPAPKPGPRTEGNPAEEPFGDMPLPVTAVLVDMRIGFSALSELKVGDILPVAVARSVPLKVGDKTIAHGTIGEIDDRVAVQITHAF